MAFTHWIGFPMTLSRQNQRAFTLQSQKQEMFRQRTLVPSFRKKKRKAYRKDSVRNESTRKGKKEDKEREREKGLVYIYRFSNAT